MNRILLIASCLAAIFSLTGCLSGGRAGHEGGTVRQDAPKVDIHVPPPQVVDQEKVVAELGRVRSDIQTEIQHSSNNTQNALSGLVNASVSKVAERVTGVEATVKDLLTINNTATANINTQFDSMLKATATMEARMDNVVTFNNNMQADLKATVNALSEIKVELGKINGAAQVGFNNKIEQLQQDLKNTAGRDVNYLPKEAVYMFVTIISILAGLATTIAVVMGNNARQRERLETEKERENVKYWQQVAMRAIGSLDPDKAAAVTRDLGLQDQGGKA